MGRILVVLLLVGVTAAVALVAWGDSEDGAGPGIDRGAAPTPTERVRVEVLNAGGVNGLARTATLELRDAGFDVVHFGNARAFDRDTSAVIDRVGRADFAEAVANALGIGTVLTEPDPNLFVDVTVLLGRSWSDPREAGTPREPPARAPWDPRGWLGL